MAAAPSIGLYVSQSLRQHEDRKFLTGKRRYVVGQRPTPLGDPDKRRNGGQTVHATLLLSAFPKKCFRQMASYSGFSRIHMVDRLQEKFP